MMEIISAATAVVCLALSLVNGWLVIVLRNMREDLIALRNSDQEIRNRLNAHELVVAGDYVKRAEFKQDMDAQTKAIFRRLDEVRVDLKGGRA